MENRNKIHQCEDVNQTEHKGQSLRKFLKLGQPFYFLEMSFVYLRLASN